MLGVVEGLAHLLVGGPRAVEHHLEDEDTQARSRLVMALINSCLYEGKIYCIMSFGNTHYRDFSPKFSLTRWRKGRLLDNALLAIFVV